MEPTTALAMGQFGMDLGSSILARKDNRRAMREQMEFQERMSSTAYQRAAKDLEAAGLNRVLALGGPASSPGGSAMPAVELRGDAMGVASAKAAIEKTKAETKLINAQAGKEQFTKGAYDRANPYLQKFFDYLESKVSSTGDLKEKVEDGLKRVRNESYGAKTYEKLTDKEKSDLKTEAMYYLQDQRRKGKREEAQSLGNSKDRGKNDLEKMIIDIFY